MHECCRGCSHIFVKFNFLHEFKLKFKNKNFTGIKWEWGLFILYSIKNILFFKMLLENKLFIESYTFGLSEEKYHYSVILKNEKHGCIYLFFFS